MKYFNLLNRHIGGLRRTHRFASVSKINISPPADELRSLITNGHPRNNISLNVSGKVGTSLHRVANSPLCITRRKIEDYLNKFHQERNLEPFAIFDNLSPIVDTQSCFDDLLVPPDHVSRSPSDTYYIDDELLLRTHTSAHQCNLMRTGETSFLCSGDVYRRDEVDSSHYPIFHQMEGVRLYRDSDFAIGMSIEDKKAQVAADLQEILTGLATHLFGNVDHKWSPDYFPFTEPSFELEVLFNEKWLEVLGCGVIHDDVIANSQLPHGTVGYAFGLGLERLAMVLFSIPDIRLFWSQDPRYLQQFREGEIKTFEPYSKYPHCYKDVSFWLPDYGFHINDVHEIVRAEAGDLVEKVELFDEFTHPNTNRRSQAYRITYRHMDRSLTNEEVDEIQVRVRESLETKANVTLR